MGRHIWTLTAAGAAIAAVAFLLLSRFEIGLHLQAGGRPLVRIRLTVRFLSLRHRREWRLDEFRLPALFSALLEAPARAPVEAPPRRTPSPDDASPAAPPVQKTAPPVQKTAPPGSNWLQQLSDAGPLAARIAAALAVQRLTLRVRLSTGDAALTAVVCGALNAIGGAAAAGLRRLPHSPRRVAVWAQPLWRPDRIWRAELRCIARPRLSQAIFAAWHLYCAFRAGNARPGLAQPLATRRRSSMRFSSTAGMLTRAKRG